MEKRTTISLRLNNDLMQAVKARAIMNDRSANGEISAILKMVLESEKASMPVSNPDASDSE